MKMYLVVVTFLYVAGVFVAKGTKAAGPLYPAKPGFGLPLEDAEGGSYCARRPEEQCCPGRNDRCTMPFGDTLCYCDIFCNRTMTDCCPDFLGHCMGIDVPLAYVEEKPQTTIKNNCYHYGHLHMPGDKIKENCNNCTCVNALIKEEFNWKCTQKVCIVRQKVLRFVNDPEQKHSWTASNYSMFWGLSLITGVKHWLGTQRPTSHVTEMSIVRIQVSDDLPENFDAREEWPGLISGVLNQDRCAASWAFSTAGVASDRLSIHSNSVYKHTLSPQHLISCNTDHGQRGCSSGHVDRAWWFIRKVGIVSLECFPYTSGNATEKRSCSLPRSYSALKGSTCPSGKRPADVFQASPPYRIDSDETEIMKELIENGPLQAVIKVKEDFFLYKSGVYQTVFSTEYFATNVKQTNFHSVRIIGWGTDRSTGKPIKYWILFYSNITSNTQPSLLATMSHFQLCANSWGSDWGEDGYFRILRGTNESKIESFVIGAWIKVNERMLVQKRKKSMNPKHQKDKN